MRVKVPVQTAFSHVLHYYYHFAGILKKYNDLRNTMYVRTCLFFHMRKFGPYVQDALNLDYVFVVEEPHEVQLPLHFLRRLPVLLFLQGPITIS